MDLLKQRILQAMKLTYDFYNYIDGVCLTMKISNVPSNTIGDQAYCLIGARESYLKALRVGEWAGFDCSLNDNKDKALILNKLEETYTNIQRFFHEPTKEDRNMNLLIDLLEHEVQHHGQLIRYAYANKMDFPKSWNERYTV
ncbi:MULTISPECIES: hypothetical protein [Bacillus]|uniref:hypothetical protein n=1 Tax=Bacillus TaxID=1386 RepID=UPI000BB91F38|nr:MULTISPECIES: hypothetical protein [Bacillus]